MASGRRNSSGVPGINFIPAGSIMKSGLAAPIRPLASMPTEAQESFESFLELQHSSLDPVEAFTYTPMSPELQMYRR